MIESQSRLSLSRIHLSIANKILIKVLIFCHLCPEKQFSGIPDFILEKLMNPELMFGKLIRWLLYKTKF
jgi:hypothetical protein